MHEQAVIVDGIRQARPSDLEVRVNGPGKSFTLKPIGVPRQLTHDLRPRTRDFLLIAASVFAADGRTSRGPADRPELGARASRQFRIIVPVQDPGFWRGMEAQLADCLDFLMGDSFRFEFVGKSPSITREPRLDLKSDGPRIDADEVVLFSGGLDSLAGVVEALEAGARRLLLVTHVAAPKTGRVQKGLFRELDRRYPGRLIWAQVQGTHAKQVLNARPAKVVETTQRSRSFLFAAIAFAAAGLVGAPRVHFYENGIVSVNLPLNRSVVGVMATRTTHPLALAKLERLLTEIAETPIRIDNPYLKLTKTEVVERLRDAGRADLIRNTVSCSTVWGRTAEKRHCGVCSQCLDRRFAVLAAGCADQDPDTDYAVELLLGVREDDRDRIMAVDWVRRAQSAAEQDASAFGAEYAAEIAQVSLASDAPSWRTSASLYALHRRHAETINGVLARGLQTHAGRLLNGEVPSSALLLQVQTSDRKVSGNRARNAPRLPSADDLDDPGRAQERSFRRDDAFSLRIGQANGRLVVELVGLGALVGKDAEVVACLAEHHVEFGSAEGVAERGRYLHGKALATALGVNDPTVWQRVRRCRARVAGLMQSIGRDSSEAEDLIEARRGYGYRLRPDSVVKDAPDRR